MKNPRDCTLAELAPYATEYASRIRLGKFGRPKVLRRCPKCGVNLGARELKFHRSQCRAAFKFL